MAKKSVIPILEEPKNTEKILDLVANGFYDKDIYKKLKVSSKTFQKWKENHEEEYEKAKSHRYFNLLGTAESGLVKKLTGFKQKETIKTYKYTVEGEKILVGETVKTKDIAPDSLAIMFALKAGDPERWNYAEFKKLQLEEKSGNEIKDIIEQLNKYNLKPPEEDSG
ncbi:bacteriophage terminase small subunit [Lactococcus garvieae]|uniref:bacteriophage terminase small subunit n=1 Tax=Lactococcus garvieae TaxID=1363 RepID=UPI003854C4E6